MTARGHGCSKATLVWWRPMMSKLKNPKHYGWEETAIQWSSDQDHLAWDDGIARHSLQNLHLETWNPDPLFQSITFTSFGFNPQSWSESWWMLLQPSVHPGSFKHPWAKCPWSMSKSATAKHWMYLLGVQKDKRLSYRRIQPSHFCSWREMDRSNHTEQPPIWEKVAPISKQLFWSTWAHDALPTDTYEFPSKNVLIRRPAKFAINHMYNTHQFGLSSGWLWQVKMISPFHSSFPGRGHVLSHIHPDAYHILIDRRVALCLFIYSFSIWSRWFAETPTAFGCEILHQLIDGSFFHEHLIIRLAL